VDIFSVGNEANKFTTALAKPSIYFDLICRINMLIFSLALSFLVFEFVEAEDANKLVYPGIYDTVKIIIGANEKYSDDVECMTQYLIENDIVKGFYTPGLSSNKENLKKELEPYLPDAKESCERGWFKKTIDFLSSCLLGSDTD
jgi:hypothetical protein